MEKNPTTNFLMNSPHKFEKKTPSAKDRPHV
jgi:hypothetical protein